MVRGWTPAKWQQRHGTDAQKLARVRAVIEQAPDSVLARQVRNILEDKQ